MHPKLLRSFLVVATFWFITTTLYWSVQQPEVNLAALHQVKRLLPFLPIEVSQTAGILSSVLVQRDVFLYWTLPVITMALLSAVFGAALVWSFAKRKDEERTERGVGLGRFRGIGLTKGVLPMPRMLPRHDVDLGADDDTTLAGMSDAERQLLCEVLGTISAQPDAYAGEGITVPLLEHTLNVASKALTKRNNAALSAIVAAGHELGKLTAYERHKETGEWSLARNLDREASRNLGTLPGWWALPELERSAVMLAVKFYSTPWLTPELSGNSQVYRLARDLLAAADDVAAEAVSEQKQRTLDKTELPDVLFEAFVKALPQLSFQTRGLPKGVAAVAWKVGRRVYMLEIKLRDTVMKQLPADVRGALTPSGKERVRVQPFTAALLKALDARGWLVKEIDGTKLETREALWNITAGKLEFKGIIVIDVPPEHISSLPAGDSSYAVKVSGTLFTPHAARHHGQGPSSGAGAAAAMSISREDLLGSVLKPTRSDA